MADRLSREELAERSSTTIERIQRLVDLGILRSEDGTFERRDVMNVRVVGQLDAMGIDEDALEPAHRAAAVARFVTSSLECLPHLGADSAFERQLAAAMTHARLIN